MGAAFLRWEAHDVEPTDTGEPWKRSLGVACPHGLEIFLVDGTLIRNAWDSDFVQGGNGYRYRFCPNECYETELEEVAEFLNGLENYPLADEDLHSEMEHEAQNEAWEDWGIKDFRKALEEKFGLEDLDEVADDEKLFELFRQGADKANEYWENQEGDFVYIDMDRVVQKGVTEAMVRDILGIEW